MMKTDVAKGAANALQEHGNGASAWSLHVLGAGSSRAIELGASSAVLERDGRPLLMIDCGPGALEHYLRRYGALPPAVFVTHAHMDHVAGLERLFYAAWFDTALRGSVKLFMHANLVPVLQSRVADYPNAVAEGGANFWESFRLVALSRGFWLDGWWFDVFATRHHASGTSFGVALRGCFAWTGETRPIPETLSAFADGRTLVAHDCGLVGNPSHSGADDMQREYPAALRKQFLLYHYDDEAEAEALRELGYQVAVPDRRYPLHAPDPVRAEAG